MSSGLNYCETVDFCNSLYIMRQPWRVEHSKSGVPREVIPPRYPADGLAMKLRASSGSCSRSYCACPAPPRYVVAGCT